MRAIAYLTITAMLVCASELAAQAPEGCVNLIQNGGFEQRTGVPWRAARGPGLERTIEIQNVSGPAAQGRWYLEVASTGPTRVRQSVRTVPGASYVLGFAYRPRQGFDSAVDAFWGSGSNAIATLLRNSDVTTWRYFETMVTGTGTDDVDFLDQSAPDAGGALIDDVYLCRVPGVADRSCCGRSLVTTTDDYPIAQWSITPTGDFVRQWWDQETLHEFVGYPFPDDPLVVGSIRRDPFGDGVVALTAAGQIVRTFEEAGGWRVEQVMPRHVARYGGVRACALVSTMEGRFKGVWAVAGDVMLRFFRESGQWRAGSVFLNGHGERIDPASMIHLWDGRVSGVLMNGQSWGTWFENNQPDQMRFDYTARVPIARPDA